MKFRYFIQLSYAGTNYSGWQVQPNGISVQQVLNEKLSFKSGEEVEVIGAGRTDAGVHAEYFVAHFDTIKKMGKNFISEMNSFLPPDIVIHSIREVTPEAHARFSAVGRTYQYRVSTVKNPFIEDFSHYYHSILDLDLMNKAASLLIDISDFTSFSKLHGSSKTNICKLTRAEWEKQGYLLVFTISADRFLRNMVRAIVGTLMDVGKGKISIEDFKAIIESKDRCKASMSAPAKGLFLTGIEYPQDIYL